MEALGINLNSIIIYVILFTILYIVIDKKFLPSLRKTLAARQKEIQNISKLKSEAEEAKVALESKVNEQLKKAQNQARTESKELLEQSKNKADEIITQAEKKADSILKEAKIAQEQMLSKLKDQYEKDVRAGVIFMLSEVFDQDIKSVDPIKVKEALDKLSLSFRND